MNTIIISAFPGSGKTSFFNNSKNTKLKVLDSDSSKFDKSNFPDNYIDHIKENIGKVDVILVSSHKVVREALVKAGIWFNLIYPFKDNKSIIESYNKSGKQYVHVYPHTTSAKEAYISRLKKRGDSEQFIELISNNWNDWLDECINQKNCKHIRIGSSTFISDIYLRQSESMIFLDNNQGSV